MNMYNSTERTAWGALPIINKAALISTAVKNGITNLSDIRSAYNKFAMGGSTLDTYYGDDPLRNLVDSINKRSKANFVQRLKDPNRAVIQDWEDPRKVATHKMSWATDDQGRAIVYPNVQMINGKLHDFTDPKYKHDPWDSYTSAIQNGDTLMMSPQEARMLTERYKDYYPTFGVYGFGGYLYNGKEESSFAKGGPLSRGIKAIKEAARKKLEETSSSPEVPSVDYSSYWKKTSDNINWDKVHDKSAGWPVERTMLLSPVTIEGEAPKFHEVAPSSIYNNDYLNNSYEKEIKAEIKKSPESIKVFQRRLAENGYYDLQTDDLSIEQIKNYQRKIGAKVDGIWGKESTQKWREYNIDGKWGARTENAYNKSTALNQNWGGKVPTEDYEWCAEWVRHKVEDSTGDDFGVRGHAWRMLSNIVANGGTEVYNIYNQDSFSKVRDVNDLKKKTVQAIKENPLDLKTLQVGDVVGIYMPSSDKHEEALTTGTTFNTHVGVVTSIDKDGMPIIEHNIHRKPHKDRANRLTGSLSGTPRIAAVSRPNYSAAHTPFDTESVQSSYTKKGDSPLFVEYANSAAGSKDLISKVFPNVDVDELERVALAVQGRETNFMKNKLSDQTGLSALKTNVRSFVRDKVKKTDEEDVSSDLAKMKLSSFSLGERRLLGLKSAKDLEDPKLAGRAAMFLLAKNWNQFERLRQENPGLRITEDDVRYLTELSYNQGMDKLANIGFDSKGKAAPEELEAIRAMSSPDAKVKDITSTNYKYLGSIGEFLYDTFGEEHTPYISAAETNRKKLMETAQKNRLLAAR